MNGAELLEAWRSYLDHSRRRSPHTVRAYLACAGRLLKQRESWGWSDLARLEGPDLRRHMASRRAEGIGNASAARELSALKSFIGFAREQAGVPDPSPPRLRGPRIKKGLPRPITPDDATNVADLVAGTGKEEWTGARDRAVLLLLYGSGMRISEALSLKGKDVPLIDIMMITGKGGKQRVVPVLPICREAVAHYTDFCPWPLAPTSLYADPKSGRCIRTLRRSVHPLQTCIAGLQLHRRSREACRLPPGFRPCCLWLPRSRPRRLRWG